MTGDEESREDQKKLESEKIQSGLGPGNNTHSYEYKEWNSGAKKNEDKDRLNMVDSILKIYWSKKGFEG